MENEINQDGDNELVYVICKNCNFRVRVLKDIDLNTLFELIYCCDDCDLEFENED